MGVSVWVGGLFTRFKREEVATMKSGKRDKERGQIDDIVNVMTTLAPGATNEREGSEITPKIVSTISLRADGRRTFKLIEGGAPGEQALARICAGTFLAERMRAAPRPFCPSRLWNILEPQMKALVSLFCLEKRRQTSDPQNSGDNLPWRVQYECEGKGGRNDAEENGGNERVSPHPQGRTRPLANAARDSRRQMRKRAP
jgi:hypothetical protein